MSTTLQIILTAYLLLSIKPTFDWVYSKIFNIWDHFFTKKEENPTPLFHIYDQIEYRILKIWNDNKGSEYYHPQYRVHGDVEWDNIYSFSGRKSSKLALSDIERYKEKLVEMYNEEFTQKSKAITV